MKTAKQPPKQKEKKKKPRTSLNAMAMAELKQLGFVAWTVESVIPHTFIKRDFMGWADIIYVCGSIVGVQVTSGDSRSSGTGDSGNRSAHRAKILAEPRALAWLEAGGLVELWCYARSETGWVLTKEAIVEEDFA